MTITVAPTAMPPPSAAPAITVSTVGTTPNAIFPHAGDRCASNVRHPVKTPSVGAHGVIPKLAACGWRGCDCAARGGSRWAGACAWSAACAYASPRARRVRLEDGCLLGAGCRIEANAGTVRIGPGARLGERSVLVSLRGDRRRRGLRGRRVGGDLRRRAGVRRRRAPDAAPAGARPHRCGSATARGSALHAAVLAGAAIAPGEVGRALRDARAAQLVVDRRRLARDVGPVERAARARAPRRRAGRAARRRSAAARAIRAERRASRARGSAARRGGRRARPRAGRRCRRRSHGQPEAIASSATSPNGS